MITIFKRKCWTRDKSYPGGFRPYSGRRSFVQKVDTTNEARTICKRHNDDRATKDAPFMEFTADY